MRCVKKITCREGNRMKFKIFVSLMVIMLAGCSSMKDAPVAIDGKHILVTDFSEPLFGAGNTQVHSNDLKGGVYVVASPHGFASLDDRLPNAERAIGEVFKSHGLKVSDTLENSSMALTFTTLLALDIVRADQAAAYSPMPNAGQVIGGAGQMIGAGINSIGTPAGGAGGLVGFAMGAMFNLDSKLYIAAMEFKTPSRRDNSHGSFVNGEDVHSAGASVFYKLEKGKEAPDDAVLKMAVGEWIRHFVIFDTPTIEAEASAVPVAQITPAAPELLK